MNKLDDERATPPQSLAVMPIGPDAALDRARRIDKTQHWGWGAGEMRPYTYPQSNQQAEEDRLVSSLLGIDDAASCTQGSVSGCLWTTAGLVPIGKIGKIGKVLKGIDKIAGDVKGAEGLIGASRTYVDLTVGGSVRNIGTNATQLEFANTLRSGGWASSLSQDGTVQVFAKDGAKYVLRSKAGSYEGWTADYTPSGSSDVTLKTRLGYQP